MATRCVSLDQCKNWGKNGKKEFVKLCKVFVESDEDQLENLNGKELKRALYELCGHVIKGNLNQDHALSVLVELFEINKVIPSVLADVLSLLDIEASCSDDESQQSKVNSLIKACAGFITEPVLKERLELETLESLGLISSKQNFQHRYVKTKTRLYYKQQKFNLLREESEGYAKLVSELGQEMTDKISPGAMLQNIKSLIGCFHLDPNRVLDIILEAFEYRPYLVEFYVPLLRSYMNDESTLSQVLGFKFQSCQQTAGNETPASLYKVAALLLQNDLVTLESLYPHLAPPDSNITQKYKGALDEARQFSKRMRAVATTEKSESIENDKDKNIQLTDNQKLGLCESLLAIGDWQHAKLIMDRLPQYFATAQANIAQSLCSLISNMIEPLYMKYSGLSEKLKKKREACARVSSDKKASTFSEFQQVIFPMLRYLGPHLSCSTLLMIKIIRLCRSFVELKKDDKLAEDAEVIEAAFLGVLTILDEVLLPSLSLLTSNCNMAEELWSLLKFLPYVYRYRLYGQWKNETYNIHPKLMEVKAECLKRSKYILMRLTKESVKPSGRQIGKLSHCNPAVFFEYMMIQIQVFDIITPVVDALKYLTPLSYDVLVFCIIEALANPEKEKMKHDDTNISRWIQSLATFSGSICKKYQVDLSGLLQYVTNQLKAGKSFDLLILREVVQKMSGIEISEEITDDQLHAMSGGELLKQEGGQFAQVRNTKRTSSRLKDNLVENDLAIPLILLMAQQRDCIIYQEGGNKHLKLVGKLYDQCQDTLAQYGSFLSTQLNMEEYTKRLPVINELIATYHAPADVAFFLSRQMYIHAINTKFDELKKIDKSNKVTGSQQKTQRYIESVETVINPIRDIVRPLHPPKTWEDLSAQFYVTFWTMNTYDLYVPVKAYEKQIQLLRQQQDNTENNRDLTQNKKKKEKERCGKLADNLADEMKKHQDHVYRVSARLNHEKESWFLSKSTKNETITQLLQLCIFPRCCFTAIDAIFCAKLIRVLHELKTPNFSTLLFYDRVFNDITYTVTCCTENEAHRYGRFLCTTFEIIMQWHSSKEVYMKECYDYPGFLTLLRKPENPSQMSRLDYENYRHVCHKWHFRITKAMVSCLESGNFIQIRNALIILTKTIAYYPKILNFGQALERRVNKIVEEEKDKRRDLYALAYLYSGQLKQKKKTWIGENDFHQKDKPTESVKTAKPASEMRNETKTEDGNKEIESKKKMKENDSVDNKDKEKKTEKVETGTVVKKEMKSPPPVSEKREIRIEKKEREPSSEGKEREKETKDETKEKREKGSDRSHSEEKAEKKERKEKSSHHDKSRSKDKHRSKDKGDEKDGKSYVKEERDERSTSITSDTSKSSRPSQEPSPTDGEEKETKRRKLDTSNSSKEYVNTSTERESRKKSKSPSRDEREKKSDRKRAGEDRQDKEDRELKKKKTEEISSTKLSSEQNGEKMISPSVHKDKHRDKEKKRDSKDKDRKSDKHSSKKSSRSDK